MLFHLVQKILLIFCQAMRPHRVKLALAMARNGIFLRPCVEITAFLE